MPARRAAHRIAGEGIEDLRREPQRIANELSVVQRSDARRRDEYVGAVPCQGHGHELRAHGDILEHLRVSRDQHIDAPVEEVAHISPRCQVKIDAGPRFVEHRRRTHDDVRAITAGDRPLDAIGPRPQRPARAGS